MEASMTRRVAWISLTLAVTFGLFGGLLGGPLGVPLPVAAQMTLEEVPLAMEKDTFVPAELKVRAGVRFILVLTNRDEITHELDIPKLRLEKKVRPGQTLKVQMPALKPGTYELVDDDAAPELHGVMIAE
jgi:heme/copper-type cytochrome/quinol oxidase subunit 2